MSSKYRIGRATHKSEAVSLTGATAIGPGASVTVNGRTYTVPPGRTGLTVDPDGTVTYF